MSRWFLLALLAVLAIGCSQSSSAAPVGGKGYELTVTPPAGAAVNAEAAVHVTVTPASGYHMNKDFPTTLEVTPPAGVTLAKAKLDKGDAVKFEESGIALDVKLTPTTPGAKEFTAVFKFAVCTQDSCLPKRESLAWTVNVK